MLETQVTTTRSNLNEFFVKNQGDIEVTHFYPLLVRKDLRFCVFYTRTSCDVRYVVNLIYPESWDEFYDNHKNKDDILHVIPIALPHFQKHVFAALIKEMATSPNNSGLEPKMVTAREKESIVDIEDHRVEAIASSLTHLPPDDLQFQLTSLGNQHLIDKVRHKVALLQNIQVNLFGTKGKNEAASGVAVFGAEKKAVAPVIEPVPEPVVEPVETSASVDVEEPVSGKSSKKKRGRAKHDD